MFEYHLDESREDHHLLKEAPKDYSPQAVVGIRPCDADAFLLVKRNFDTPDYKDPYWIRAYEATTLVGLACNTPCSTCFCTSAGSGPFSETGLDVLLVDQGDHYLARVITDKGEQLSGGRRLGRGEADEADAEADRSRKGRGRGEHRVRGAHRSPGGQGDHRALRRPVLGRCRLFLHQLRDLHLPVPHLLVLRHPGRNPRQIRGADAQLGQLHVSPVYPARLGAQPPEPENAAGAPALHAQTQILRGQIR